MRHINILLIVLTILFYFSSNVKGEPITHPSQLSPNPIIIDFEEFDTEGNMLTVLPNPVMFGGVTFTCLTGTPYIFDISLSYWPLLTQVTSKTMFPGESEPDSAISIQFPIPVAEVLLGWGDPSYPGNFLLAFDAEGNLLESIEVPIGQAAWVGFKRKTADIAMVITQPNQQYPSGDDYVIDNIYYNFNPVSEPITIDIKPGSYPNCFNQNEKGVIPVAIFGSVDLDVTQINIDTLTLQGLAVKMVGKSNKYLAHYGYVNDDDYLDLIVQFQDSDRWISSGNDYATLSGELMDGTAIEGKDTICIVP